MDWNWFTPLSAYTLRTHFYATQPHHPTTKTNERYRPSFVVHGFRPPSTAGVANYFLFDLHSEMFTFCTGAILEQNRF